MKYLIKARCLVVFFLIVFMGISIFVVRQDLLKDSGDISVLNAEIDKTLKGRISMVDEFIKFSLDKETLGKVLAIRTDISKARTPMEHYKYDSQFAELAFDFDDFLYKNNRKLYFEDSTIDYFKGFAKSQENLQMLIQYTDNLIDEYNSKVGAYGLLSKLLGFKYLLKYE